MGVALKGNEPSMASNAESFGFIVQGLIILRVMSACSIMRHQWYIGKDAAAPALLEAKRFLQVCMQRSAMLVRLEESLCL